MRGYDFALWSRWYPPSVTGRGNPAAGLAATAPKVLVIGAFDSGVEELGSSLACTLGWNSPQGAAATRFAALEEFNERLLVAMGGTSAQPPSVPASEVAGILSPFAAEARDLTARSLGQGEANQPPGTPWVWADPRLCLVAPFWLEVLDGPVVAVLVHRAPHDVARSDLERWDRYNRSALGVATSMPTAVVGFRELNEVPTDAYRKIAKFLSECEIDVDAWPAADSAAPGWLGPTGADTGDHQSVPMHLEVLHGVLCRYEAEMAPQPGTGRPEVERRYDDLRRQFDEFQAGADALLAQKSQELADLELRRAAEFASFGNTLYGYEQSQSELAQRLNEVELELAQQRDYVNAIHNTRMYKLTWQLRKFYFLRRTVKDPEFENPIIPDFVPSKPNYARWISMYDTLDDAARDRLRAQLAVLTDPPLISVILPTYNTPRHFLNEAIDSVRTQIYPNWELCIVDDCSTDPELAPAMEQLAASDERITFVRREENGHISAASNTGLAMASGSWVAFLDHDDKLADTALAFFALKICQDPQLRFIYSDEDKISETGERKDPNFKPDFDPLLLQGQNYLCHLSMYRKDLVDSLGGLRVGFEGSQDWDLALRITDVLTPGEIAHIPRPVPLAHPLGVPRPVRCRRRATPARRASGPCETT